MTETEDPGKIDVYYAMISTVLNDDAAMTAEKGLTEENEKYHPRNGLTLQKKSKNIFYAFFHLSKSSFPHVLKNVFAILDE